MRGKLLSDSHEAVWWDLSSTLDAFPTKPFLHVCPQQSTSRIDQKTAAFRAGKSPRLQILGFLPFLR